MASTALRLFGTEEPVEAAVLLRAGPLALSLRRGKLLHIRHGNREIWHGVAFVYRDPDWGTPEPVFDDVQVTPSEHGFRARLRGQFPVSPPIRLVIDIEGTRDGRIRFVAEAIPSGDILCNRIGVCAMHPMSACGARIDIAHIDGRHSHSTFPLQIPAQPPFMLIRAIRHEWTAGHWARCELAGDDFELEDQRNNADASFKTYSRSNLMPRPYRLPAGVAIRHSAELSVKTPGLAYSAPSASAVVVGVGSVAGALPSFGIEIHPRDAKAPDMLRGALRWLRPAHLHLALRDGHNTVDWRGVGVLLAAAGARLRLDLTLSDAPGDSLAQLRAALDAAGIAPEGVAVFPSDARTVDAARTVFPDAAIGGGTPHFFVQLNRLEGLGPVDFASFTTSPIVHGADDEDVMLGLQSLPSMVRTLAERHPSLPLRIGPSTIAARASPLGLQPPSDGTRRIALAAHDPRCRGLFGAAWAVGYFARFAQAGVQSVTLLSLTGPSGVLHVEQGSLVRHPAAFALARFGAFRHARRAAVVNADPSRLAALAFDRSGRRELLVANLGGEPVDVVFPDRPALGTAWIMDACTSADGWRVCADPDAPRERLRLEAYAVARLELR